MDRAWLSLFRKGSTWPGGRVSLRDALAGPGPLFHDLDELSDPHVCALPKPGWGKPANAVQ